jgi:hypothetical protein
MGILRLGDFLKKTCSHVIKPRPPIAYKKGRYAVDASSTIYSFLAKTISKYCFSFSIFQTNS